ncbi:MAG: hypothetical protein AB1589_36295 [Cyanobacteriota bacterium]
MYSIIDKENRVIGEWQGQVHIVLCYCTRKEARADALKLSVPYQIVRSEIALGLLQSKHSK